MFSSLQGIDPYGSVFPEDLVEHISQYADHVSIANWSGTSRFFFNKSMTLEFWCEKIINAGCNETLFRKVIRLEIITQFNHLYRNLLKLPLANRKKNCRRLGNFIFKRRSKRSRLRD